MQFVKTCIKSFQINGGVKMATVEIVEHDKKEYEIRGAVINERYNAKVFLEGKQVSEEYSCVADGDTKVIFVLIEQIKADIINGKLH
jgi:hypothetical protein